MKNFLSYLKLLLVFGVVVVGGTAYSNASFADNEYSTGNLFSAGSWVTPPPPVLEPARVVINEVMYDPIGAEPQGEWVELYNAGGSSIDLAGFILTDGEASLTLPSYSMGAGAYAIFARDATTFNTNYGFMPAFSGSTIALANGGDDIALYDPTANVVDAATWKNGSFPGVTPHPGIVAQNHTLARNPDGIDTDNCAVDFVDSGSIPSTLPTPGGPNV